MSEEDGVMVVNESIYGAFQGLMCGENKIGIRIQPHPDIITLEEKSYTIYGDSGDESDVLAEDVKIDGSLRVGDRLLFNGLSASSPNWMTDGIRICFQDDDQILSQKTTKETMPRMRGEEDGASEGQMMSPFEDVEFENAFQLPDITDEQLEGLFVMSV